MSAPYERVCYQYDMVRDMRDNLEAVLWLSMTICMNAFGSEFKKSIVS
jgi:hypothetical protein